MNDKLDLSEHFIDGCVKLFKQRQLRDVSLYVPEDIVDKINFLAIVWGYEVISDKATPFSSELRFINYRIRK